MNLPEPDTLDVPQQSLVELSWDTALLKAAMRAGQPTGGDEPRRRNSNNEASSLSSVTYVDESRQIVFPDGTSRDVVDATEFLKKLFPIWNNKQHKQSFSGKEAVNSLKITYLISSDEAIRFGEQLRLANYIRHVNDEYKPFTESNGLYRLCCHHEPNVLNSFNTWPAGKKCLDPVQLSVTLLAQVQKLEKRLLHHGQINYKYACRTSQFPPFEYAVCELQAVDLKSMSNEAKLVSHPLLLQGYLKWKVPFLTRSSPCCRPLG